jgi:hypothetical protein
MNVSITEIKTSKIVATYLVNIEGLNYKPESQESFDLAWRCAVDDGIVEDKNKKNYSLKFV